MKLGGISIGLVQEGLKGESKVEMITIHCIYEKN